MIVESLFHYQLIVDIYCHRYYIFIVFNITLVPLLLYKTSARYLNYRVVKNIVATTISFSLSVVFMYLKYQYFVSILYIHHMLYYIFYIIYYIFI